MHLQVCATVWSLREVNYYRHCGQEQTNESDGSAKKNSPRKGCVNKLAKCFRNRHQPCLRSKTNVSKREPQIESKNTKCMAKKAIKNKSKYLAVQLFQLNTVSFSVALFCSPQKFQTALQYLKINREA